jgi:hypothetical protein
MPTSEQISRILRRCLKEGRTVAIDGLGTFRPGKDGHFEFTTKSAPRVFLGYVAEDRPRVIELYQALKARGFDPWMDCMKLLPGQNWPRAIERAISVADFFIPCFSKQAAVKRGRFHSELRYALDCASMQPLDGIFIVPVRLDDCPIPRLILESIQFVDLFPDFDAALDHMSLSMRSAPKRPTTSS